MTQQSETVLPVGASPKALEFSHFPTRQQAVVWRNWELVPVERLARILNTGRKNVLDLAAGMGLRVPPNVAEQWLQRGYCTLIRNNWHLLPYEQLLELLGWTAEKLAFSLREEDGLWIKLGLLKPRVDPVCYSPLTPDEAERTAALKAVVGNHFGDPAKERIRSRPFKFLDEFRTATPQPLPPKRPDSFDLQFVYSYSAPYGDSLMYPELDPYPDGLLAHLAGLGVTGVWLPALLYTLNPWEPDAEMSADWETRLENLRRLAQRVAKHGLGLFVYLNEPRGLPLTSQTFQKHPEWKGIDYADWGIRSLCTSQQPVLDFVRDGAARLFREVPELAGAFTINMSEFPTHCHSRWRGNECPRCSQRPVQETVVEVIRAIEEGIHSAKSDARVLLYTWAWAPEWAHQAVDLLPADVEVMCVSEWGLPIHVGGVDYSVIDYSISQVGPSKESVDLWQHAIRRGLKAVAKVQMNNSWELSAVPYIPVPDLVEEHLANLRRAGVSGLMLSWTVGGYPGGNLKLLNRSFAELAVAEFGRKTAPLVKEACRCFSDAFREFPFSCPVIYNAPHNCGPANLLYAKPTGYASTMVQGLPYDDLKGWRDVYPEDVFEDQFRKLSEGWNKGLELLEQAQDLVAKAKRKNLDELRRMALAAYCHFRSTYLQIRFVRLRGATGGPDHAKIVGILDEEIHLAKTLGDLVRDDSRIGFEAANHYAYTLNDLKEKVLNCEWLRKECEAQKGDILHFP